MNKCVLGVTLAISASSALAEKKENKDKNPEDPTKIVTRLGAGYASSGVTFSGSLGLDQVRMINASVDADFEEWNIGGSWLFDIGIVNFNIFADDYRTSYNLGTYVPLSVFDIEPAGIQIFPMGGVTFTNPSKESEEDGDEETWGGYLGGFALKPFSPRWTGLTYLGGNVGSNDYSGVWGGLGVAFRIDKAQSIDAWFQYSHDSYREDVDGRIGYKYEF